jgi:cell division protein FtsA
MVALLDDNERARPVEIPSVGGRQPRSLSRQILCEILQPRAEEIFGHAYEEIQRAGFERQILSSVVLVGGGSMLEGIVEMAEQVLDLPARHGIPTGIGGLTVEVDNPACATVVGLVTFENERRMNTLLSYTMRESRSGQTGLWDRVKGYFPK